MDTSLLWVLIEMIDKYIDWLDYSCDIWRNEITHHRQTQIQPSSNIFKTNDGYFPELMTRGVEGVFRSSLRPYVPPYLQGPQEEAGDRVWLFEEEEEKIQTF